MASARTQHHKVPEEFDDDKFLAEPEEEEEDGYFSEQDDELAQIEREIEQLKAQLRILIPGLVRQIGGFVGPYVVHLIASLFGIQSLMKPMPELYCRKASDRSIRWFLANPPAPGTAAAASTKVAAKAVGPASSTSSSSVSGAGGSSLAISVPSKSSPPSTAATNMSMSASSLRLSSSFYLQGPAFLASILSDLSNAAPSFV